jgi:hypothetical protein
MTGIMAVVLGTAPSFNPAAGLYTRGFAGYFADDVNYFAGATQVSQAVDTGTLQNSGSTPYSQQWIGYFRPNTTENYRFYLQSSDASFFWIGSIALSGFSTANATVNNAGRHPVQTTNSALVSLVANTYYPVRIQFGNDTPQGFFNPTGQNTFDFGFERVNTDPGNIITNLTGLSFYNSSTRGF